MTDKGDQKVCMEKKIKRILNLLNPKYIKAINLEFESEQLSTFKKIKTESTEFPHLHQNLWEK